MDLIIKNKIITEPIVNILHQIQRESGYPYFSIIKKESSENVSVTCPFHKEGKESHPSCFIYNRRDNPEVQYGFVKCFTCGKQVPLFSMVGYCFGQGDEFGKEWLVDNFGDILVEEDLFLAPIELNDSKKKLNNYIDESILDKYDYFHPYLEKRHLNKEVCERFRVGYDRETNSITFPIWDYSGGLVGITKRNVDTKRFDIPADMNKAVYLLNFIREDNVDTVYVCESQINALTLWGWGYPAVALLGTGSKHQYEILRATSTHNYILCLDGDDAGRKGTERFIKNMNSDVFVSIKQIPQGKDVNDLTKEQFDSLPIL